MSTKRQPPSAHGPQHDFLSGFVPGVKAGAGAVVQSKDMSGWELSHQTATGMTKKCYTCAICEITVGNSKDYKKHMLGRKHQQALQQGAGAPRKKSMWLRDMRQLGMFPLGKHDMVSDLVRRRAVLKITVNVICFHSE
jgi:hypothetical protein